MIIEFDPQEMFTQSLQIDDPGNTCLQCSNNLHDYYICTQTVYGKVYLLKFGPFISETSIVSDYFSVTYSKFDYKESKVFSELSKFVQDPKKEINRVVPAQLGIVLNKIPSGVQLFSNFDMED